MLRENEKDKERKEILDAAPLSWYCKPSLERQYLYLFSDSAIFVVKKKNWQVGGYSCI